jgi:hypothetical protein
MELLDELGGPSVRGDFLDAMREARSNVPEHGDGAAIFAAVT